MVNIPFIAIIGATASGKSKLSEMLATKILSKKCEVISCDSVQVFKGFDIGSAKVKKTTLIHHMIDIVEWNQDFDAVQFVELAKQKIKEINSRGSVPLVVGGTGLYLDALRGVNVNSDLPNSPQLRQKLSKLSADDLVKIIKQFDRKRANEIHINDHFRLVRAAELVTLLKSSIPKSKPVKQEDDNLIIHLNPKREELHQRIALRTQNMLEIGLINEVENLLARGVSPNCKAMLSIGYKQCVEYLNSKLSLEEFDLQNRIIYATRQYAKRQCTWFKKTPVDIEIASPTEPHDLLTYTKFKLFLKRLKL